MPKEQSGNVVLYPVMDPTFLAQDYDLRHRMAVGIQQFWAFRCQGMGVADLNSAHLVLVSPEGRGGAPVRTIPPMSGLRSSRTPRSCDPV